MRKSLSVFLILLLSLSLLSFLPQAYSQGENWLSGWTYRKSHVINNATGAGTNYQTQIYVWNSTGTDSGNNVTLGSHVLSNNFGDIRFTDDDGNTLLDYWMESVNSTTATFWVEIADSLESAAQTIYVYYGKADATTTSNITNTFLFGDEDFATGWALKYGSVTAWGVTNGELWVQCTTLDAWIGKAFSYTLGNIKLIYRFKFDVSGTGAMVCAALESASTPVHPSAVAARIDTANVPDRWQVQKSNPEQIIELFQENVTTNWYRGMFTFVLGTNTCKLWINDAYKGSATFSAAPPTAITFIGIGGYVDDFRIDYIAAAKYVAPEPAHAAWGSEETSGKEPYYYTCEPSETVAATATLSASKLVYSSADLTTITTIEQGAIKSVYMSTSVTAQPSAIMEYSKFIAIGVLEINLFDTIIPFVARYVTYPFIEIALTAEEAAAIGIIFGVIAIAVCTGLIYAKRRQEE